MTRRIAATLLASVIGGVILSAAPSQAVEVCVSAPTRQGGNLFQYCLTDSELLHR